MPEDYIQTVFGDWGLDFNEDTPGTDDVVDHAYVCINKIGFVTAWADVENTTGADADFRIRFYVMGIDGNLIYWKGWVATVSAGSRTTLDIADAVNSYAFGFVVSFAPDPGVVIHKCVSTIYFKDA